MARWRTRWRRWLAASATVAAGCTGTEVGNPVEETPLALLARSSDAAVVSRGNGDAGDSGAPSGATLDALWVVLGDLRFVTDADCASDRDTRITVRGPVVAELSSGPEELHAVLANGPYCRVRVPLDRLNPALVDAGTPEALDGHSVLFEGRRADGTPFRILSRDKRELELRTRSEPFTLERTERAMILSFDVAAWLDGVDLDGAAPNASGEVVIDETVDRTRLAAFEENLGTSLRLYRDLDEDGDLDPGELAEELARGQ